MPLKNRRFDTCYLKWYFYTRSKFQGESNMARSSIIYYREPSIHLWRVVLGAICLVIIAVCGTFLFSLGESKTETHSPMLIASLSNPYGVTPRYVTQPEADMTTVPETAKLMPAQTKESGEATLPPYGAEALGAKGAWDGHSGVDDAVLRQDTTDKKTQYKDYQGRDCVENARKIAITTLRTLIPPRGYPDGCAYRSALAFHAEMLPSDFFSENLSEVTSVLTESDIASISKNKQWGTSDIEQLIPLNMAELVALDLFVLLRDRGSQKTEILRSGTKEGYIEVFLRTGKCVVFSNPNGPCGSYMLEK